MKRTLLSALMGAAFITPLAAQAEGVYARANIGQSEYSAGGSVHETAWALGIGYDFDKNFGVELGYFDLGKLSGNAQLPLGYGSVSGSASAEVITLAGVGSWNVTDDFSVFGKLGVAYDRLKASGTATEVGGASATVSVSESYTKPYVAVGVAYQLTKELAATVDYNYFGKVSEADVKLSAWTLGLKYHF